MKFSKLILVSAVLAAQTVLSAPKATKPVREMTQAERRAAWMKHTGDLCDGVSKGGAYVFVDCTKDGIPALKDSAGRVERLFTLVVRTERSGDAKGGPLAVARSMMKGRQDIGAITVFYDGAADEPIELYSPMEKVAVVNVTPLRSSDAKKEADRILAMANRSAIFAAGGVMLFGYEGVMKNIYSVEDIDKLAIKTAHPLSLQQVKLNAEEVGVSMRLHGTYRTACRQGWAPAPTNDLQKAVWDEVHSEIEKGPAKALTIRPPMPPR